MAGWRRILRHAGRFRAGEEGGVTAFGVLSIGLLLLLAGVAIDVTNAYRHRALLQIAADSAAQAGIVALARGEDIAQAHQAAEAMIEMNLPEAGFGQLLTDPATELQVLHYDPGTGRIAPADAGMPPNAVLVRLQRSKAAGNPLPTLLMGLAGHDAWSLAATSVAVLTPTRRCGNAEGIVARDGIDLGISPGLGAGFCLHSQTAITLPAGTHAAGPLRISLPDPSHCAGLCDPATASGGPDPELRPIPLNLVMPRARHHVARLAAGFLDPQTTLPEEAAFFATRPLDGDPEALREVGLQTGNLRSGAVLRMTPLQFSQLRERPAGLVYEVACDTVENDPRPVWERSLVLLGDGYDVTLRDLVLITDCAIAMDDAVRVEGALILLTGPEEALISALPGTSLGDPEMKCDPARRVRLMALGDLALPADLARSNVSAVAGGSILLEGDPDQWLVPHVGLVLHAGGGVVAEGSHSFDRCPTEATADPLMPVLQVIAHVMPPLGDVLAPPAKVRPETDMPGEKAKRLPMQETVRSGS